MTKCPVHKQTHRFTQKHVEHKDATDIQKTIFLGFVFTFKAFRLNRVISCKQLTLRENRNGNI